jgi:phenylalanyl-tRNA synthetase beta subunit
MPVISFNKKYLYGLIGSDIDDQKLADHISKLGFEVEQTDDKNVSVEITANRLDLLDAVGLARTLRNFMHKSKKFYYEIDAEPALELTVGEGVKSVRPFISALVVRNVKLNEDALANMMNF